MATTAHDHEALARQAEVAELHPTAEPKHLLAPLATRIVLRSLEAVHGDRELAIVGESFLTAVVDGGRVLFYAGCDPVWKAASIDVSRIAGVENTVNDVGSGEFLPHLRLTGRLTTGSLYDLDFEVLHVKDGELRRDLHIDDELTWWVEATEQ
ncbi:hypothetical protein EDF46_1710 [Frondihabitans sp. PhB188]|uniref:hypothetical protein n=1 Tax=Frondihabitans sp. PhB188 TaxID=2485200 RepID=UPI000F48D39A|nr:hypothetical protein [Frondihabitans sp. PhB188]ROQ40073.1 hypothetical protein EDF46_1710 [Frondihabitans sp. PhB188]